MTKKALFLATENAEIFLDRIDTVFFRHGFTRIHTGSSIVSNRGLHGFLGPQRAQRTQRNNQFLGTVINTDCRLNEDYRSENATWMQLVCRIAQNQVIIQGLKTVEYTVA